MKSILLAEDNIDLGSILKQYLELHKYKVIWGKNGIESYALFKKHSPSICVLDVMMPEMDGYSLAKEITKINPRTPFLFLTAKEDKKDKIKGLKLGADDYIIKPFEADELILRISNILKRSNYNSNSLKSNTVQIGDFIFDKTNLNLLYKNESKRLTKKEADLISFLYDNKEKLITREEILTNLWGEADFFTGRSMDVFITRLRGYFKKDPNISIISKKGIGFEFNVTKKNM